MTATRGSTFTTTMRVINRVHGSSPDMGTTTEPTCSPRFPQPNIHMIAISNLTNRGTTKTGNTTHLATRQ